MQLNRQIEIRVSAAEARRKINNYIHLEIRAQIHAGTPLLVIGNTVWWRVPVHLTFPSFGDGGQVGFMDVDPVTSDIDNLAAMITEITHNAENLALRFTPPTANRV